MKQSLQLNMYYDCLSNLPRDLLIAISSLLNTSGIFCLGCTSKSFSNKILNSLKLKMIDVYEDAIRNKYTKLFKWLIPDRCKKSMFGFVYAIIGIKQNICNCKYCMPQDMKHKIRIKACKFDSLETLEYMCCTDEIPIENATKIINAAAKNGGLECAKWICTYVGYDCVTRDTGIVAAEGGHLNILEWLHTEYDQLRAGYSRVLCANAAYGGQLEVIKWLHEKGYGWSSTACECAAQYGHLEVLKYLHENRCHWNKYACYRAVKNGHLEVLRYLHENGCPLGNAICSCAVENGHLEVLRYLYDNGVLCDRNPSCYRLLSL